MGFVGRRVNRSALQNHLARVFFSSSPSSALANSFQLSRLCGESSVVNMSAATVPATHPALQTQGRRALILLVVSIALARGAQLPQFAGFRDLVALKGWRDERRARREERRRRERETPLNTPALEKKMVDLVGSTVTTTSNCSSLPIRQDPVRCSSRIEVIFRKSESHQRRRRGSLPTGNCFPPFSLVRSWV